MAKRKNDDIDEKKVNRVLDFKLNTDEYAAKGKEAAQLARELGVLEGESDAQRKMWKGKCEIKQGELHAVLNTIRVGTEARRVDCLERKDYVRHMVQYIYKDEVMEERAMTLDERQLEMVTEFPKKKAQPKKEEGISEAAEVFKMETNKKTKHDSLV